MNSYDIYVPLTSYWRALWSIEGLGFCRGAAFPALGVLHWLRLGFANFLEYDENYYKCLTTESPWWEPLVGTIQVQRGSMKGPGMCCYACVVDTRILKVAENIMFWQLWLSNPHPRTLPISYLAKMLVVIPALVGMRTVAKGRLQRKIRENTTFGNRAHKRYYEGGDILLIPRYTDVVFTREPQACPVM